MAYKAKNTEHGGAKGSSAKSGYYGRRADAKRESNRARRMNDRRAVLDSEA